MIYEKANPCLQRAQQGFAFLSGVFGCGLLNFGRQQAPRHISGGLKGNIFEQGTG